MLIKTQFSFRLFPPSPFFFLFIWKGKESSLHPLRSLPDPFVNLSGVALLPACIPPSNAGDGSRACAPMGSSTRQTRIQILLLPLPPPPFMPLSPRIANLWWGLSTICISEYTGWLLPRPLMPWRRNVILYLSLPRTRATISVTLFWTNELQKKRRCGAPNTPIHRTGFL